MVTKESSKEREKRAMANYNPQYKILYSLPGARIIYRLFLEPMLNLLVKIDPSFKYNSAGLITDKNCDFLKQEDFINSWNERLKQLDNPKMRDVGKWIFHINQWAVNHAKNLKGDFVECGVYRGGLAMFNINCIDFKNMKNRKYYLFDTYCGMDKELCTKEEYEDWKEKYPDSYEFVKQSFNNYPSVIIVKGPVPNTLSKVKINKVAYLSVDMNCALPEKEALKFFWPKMVSGGIIVLDDYGWPGHESQKKEADEFVKLIGIKILSLPTGQGVIIKP